MRRTSAQVGLQRFRGAGLKREREREREMSEVSRCAVATAPSYPAALGIFQLLFTSSNPAKGRVVVGRERERERGRERGSIKRYPFIRRIGGSKRFELYKLVGSKIATTAQNKTSLSEGSGRVRRCSVSHRPPRVIQRLPRFE